MMGIQHKAGTVATSTLVATLMWKFLSFTPAIYFIVPYAYFTADSPDIDQKNSAPKKWAQLKKIIIILVSTVGIIAFGYLCYTGYLIYKGSSYSVPNMIISAIILLSYLVIYLFSKTKEGTFITKHRGFTHTLIIPILLYLLYFNISKVASNYEMNANTQILMLMINIWFGTIIFKEVFNTKKGIGKYLQIASSIVLGSMILFIIITNLGIHDVITTLVHLSLYIILGTLVGITSHIFEDMLCKAGCPILYPLSKKPLHIGTAITSDLSAWIWTIGLIAVCVIFIVFIITL